MRLDELLHKGVGITLPDTRCADLFVLREIHLSGIVVQRISKLRCSKQRMEKTPEDPDASEVEVLETKRLIPWQAVLHIYDAEGLRFSKNDTPNKV